DLKYKTAFWNGMPVKTRMSELCAALGTLDVWVRLHYVYPYPHVDEIIPLMAEGRLLPYLDIPFQHASPRILKAMRRPAASENTLQRIHAWRQTCPELTLRSTFIVGFPGETEDDFEQLLDFLDQARLDRVGCFTYSAVEGAKAYQLPNPVDEDTKQERLQRFMEKQAAISRERLRKKIGTEQRVLVDAVSESGAIARSSADAPEIDGLVYIEEHSDLQPGDFVNVHIDDTDEHDMWGRIIA
ncbi:MAG: radical SAM protein, partial [Gammaproteobacteria bacterium]